MDQRTAGLLCELNQAIIQFRGIYSAWAGAHGISYHEMLVLYTIREKGFCVQKQLCDDYLLPRQTINNVIAALRRDGVLEISRAHSAGREKAFVLTERGAHYAAPFLASLDQVEARAVELLGGGRLELLTALMLDYGRALSRALEGSR